jgi:predicted house-cleaning noncanonical NTP pyrophosphatase (MazG superfamily)
MCVISWFPVFVQLVVMDLMRIAAKVAALPPFESLIEEAESLIKTQEDEELRDILGEVIELASAKKLQAHRLMEDYREIAEEYDYAKSHGKYISDRVDPNVNVEFDYSAA